MSRCGTSADVRGVLQFMAWERSFEKRVMKIRERELKYQKLNYTIEVLWNAIWYEDVSSRAKLSADPAIQERLSYLGHPCVVLALRGRPESSPYAVYRVYFYQRCVVRLVEPLETLYRSSCFAQSSTK